MDSTWSANIKISRDDIFSWIFLVNWILILIISVFFLFYFNRVVGSIISLVLKWLLWRNHKIRIQVQSLKISFLGGRIFFKNLTIIGQNEAICAFKGTLTWQYWLHKTRRSRAPMNNEIENESINTEKSQNIRVNSDGINSLEASSGKHYDKLLSPRFLLEIDGLEWFVYNRTPAYDGIFETLKKTDRNEQEEYAETMNHNGDGRSSISSESISMMNSVKSNQRQLTVDQRTGNGVSNGNETETSQCDSEEESNSVNNDCSRILKFLPLQISCNKGAIIMGNKSTPSLLSFSFTSGTGTVDLEPASNKLDVYKSACNLILTKAVVSMKPNIDYRGQDFDKMRPRRRKAQEGFIKSILWHQFKKITSHIFIPMLPKHTPEPTQEERWRGLGRYFNEDDDTSNDYSVDPALEQEEYAKYSTILDSSECNVTYYFDIPGKVPKNPPKTNLIDGPDVGNGGPPPAWGTDISLKGVMIYYGPWTHRQRIPLQSMLLPRICRDAIPEKRRVPGQDRICTQFRLFIDIEDDATIRIPIKEFSKNEQFQKMAREQGEDADITRPFGWVELKADYGTTLSCDMCMAATETGWPNQFVVSFNKPEIRTSINHGIVFKADSHTITGDISFPLQWNGKTHWSFTNLSENGQLFILREHTTLLTDMFKDFASGAPVSYEMFTAFIYSLNWKITNYAIYLTINESNIINNPLDFDDNTFISFQGGEIILDITIPMLNVYDKYTSLKFSLFSPKFQLVLDTPPWHTLNNFLKHREIGLAHNFELKGEYTYYANVEPGNVDSIFLDVNGDYVTLETYGWIVRYILKVQENYFGENVHFQTLEEYNKQHTPPSDEENDRTFQHENSIKKSDKIEKNKETKFKRIENEIDVILGIYIRDGCIVLPANMYDCKSNVSLSFASLDIDLSFTNYYMDIQASISPVRAISQTGCTNEEVLQMSKKKISKPEMSIDSLKIHGHRLFGLPPFEPTYVCKWNFVVGNISFNCGIPFLQALGDSISNLGYGYSDLENALLVEEPIVNDITIVTFVCPLISLKINTENNSYLKIVLEKISFRMNDISNNRYTSRANLTIPVISVSVFDIADKSKLLAGFQTSLYFTDFCQKKDFDRHRMLQQAHVKLNDGPFHRIPFFLNEDSRDQEYNAAYESLDVSLPLPDFPAQLNGESVDYIFADTPFNQINDSTNGKNNDSESNYSSSTLSNSSDDEDVGRYLPPGNWKHIRRTRVRARAQSDDQTGFRPTFHYIDSEFTPNYKPDPKFEYDSFIISFGNTWLYLSPQSLPILVQLYDKFETKNLQSVIDNIQKDVVSHLEDFVSQESNVKNLKLVMPIFHFKYGDFNFKTLDVIFNDTPIEQLPSHLNAEVSHLSVTTSSQTESKEVDVEFGYNSTNEKSNENTLIITVKQIILSIQRNLHELDDDMFADSRAFALILQDNEIWSNSLSKWEEYSSQIRTLDFSIQERQLGWLQNYIVLQGKYLQHISELILPIISRSKASQIYLFNAIATEYMQQNDPSVLTKPAYITRYSKKHTRINDSWKILMKIRHSFNNVELSRRVEFSENFRTNNFDVSESVFEDVLNAFSEWRSWEFTDITKSFILRYIFEAEPQATNFLGSKLIKLQVESFIVRLVSQNYDDDFLCFDDLNLNVSCDNSPDLSDIARLGTDIPGDSDNSQIYLRVSSIRTRGSLLLLSVKDFAEKIVVSFTTGEGKEQQTQQPNRETVVGNALSVVPSHSTNNIQSPQLSQLTVLIGSIDFNFDLEKVSLHYAGTSISTAVLFTHDGDVWSNKLRLNVVHTCEQVQFNILVENHSMFSFVGEETAFSSSIVGPLRDGFKKVDLSSQHIGINCIEGSVGLCKIINSFVDHDWDIIKNHINIDHPTETPNAVPKSDTSGTAAMGIGDLMITSSINSLDWNLELLPNLILDGEIIGFSVELHKVMDIIICDIGHTNCDLRLSMPRERTSHKFVSNSMCLAKISQSNVACLAKIRTSMRLLELYVRSDILDVSLLSFSTLEDTVFISKESIEKGISDLTASISRAKKIIRIGTESSALKPTTSMDGSGNDLPLFFKIALSQDLVEFSTILDDTKYSAACEDFSVSAFTYAIGSLTDPDELVSVKPYGEINLSRFYFVVDSRNLDPLLSTIVDLNFSVKISNPENYLETDLQTLQIESSYMRVALSSGAIVKLIKLSKASAILLENLKRFELLKKEHKPITTPNSTENCKEGHFFPYLVHILSYNICIGWLFEEKDPQYPGIILGCEKVYMVSEKDLGKLTMIDSYLSVAKGNNCNNFYSEQSESLLFDRAHLPGMQLIYKITEKDGLRDVSIKISGEELNLKLLSSSMVLLEKTLRSFSDVSERLDQLNREFEGKHIASSPVIAPELKEEVNADEAIAQVLGDNLTSFSCSIGFEGGQFELYDTDTSHSRHQQLHRKMTVNTSDSGSADGRRGSFQPNTAALSLHSPTVKFYMDYLKKKNGDKKHYLKCETVILPSTNTIYAKCVPVIMDMFLAAKNMLQKTPELSVPASPRSRISSASSNILNPDTIHPVYGKNNKEITKQDQIDIAQFLEDIEISFGFSMDRQEVILSCEPTAKVSMVVGYDKLYFQVCTSSEDIGKTIYIKMDSLKAQLQHIYSREISGSIGIETIVIGGALENTLGQLIKGSASCNVSDVSCYVNLQQRQDLELFHDIWKPDNTTFAAKLSRRASVSTREKQRDEKNLVSRFHEVAATNAFPWTITLNVVNIGGQVELGQSLGRVFLDIDRIWLISRKSSDWEQNMTFGIDKILLSANRRLGGELVLTDLRLHTVIVWQMDDQIFDIPLILVSIGLESFAAKLLFDFHPFFVAKVSKINLGIYNQKDKAKILQDQLSAIIDIESVYFYMTSLAASNFYDIYKTLDRLHNDSNALYRQVLRDSAPTQIAEENAMKLKNPSPKSEKFNIGTLRTMIDVTIGAFGIQIYPNSLADSKVFVIKSNVMNARYSQGKDPNNKITGDLELKMKEIFVALSTFKHQINADTINKMSINEYEQHANSVHGGGIISFPSLNLSMQTWQLPDMNDIEYKFVSSFGDDAVIKWNLGPVNFIREMWHSHARALASRLENEKRAEKLEEKVAQTTKSSTLDDIEADDGDKDEDQLYRKASIEEHIRDVELNTKYTYIALSPPEVGPPQVKELGNATPPLEWFGLHRKRFPGFVHQGFIVALQKLTRESAIQYQKILGKA